MSTTTLPLPPVTEPAAGLDLDGRIALAEARLVARQERLRRGLHAVGQRVQRRWRPWRRTLPVLGGALALGVVGGLWGLRRPLRHAASTAQAPPSRNDGVPWVHLMSLAWPLLPAHWRAHISPATASAVAGLGLPLAERLLKPRPRLPALTTVARVDLARYAGRWYEVARLPASFESACTGQPIAHYTLDGAGLQVLNQCPAGGADVRSSRGQARVVSGSDGARLEVSFWPSWLRWLPGAWSDYWILHLDDDYTEALVGTPGREFLWLLSRRPTLPAERVEAMTQFARGLGFAVERLQFSSVPAARRD